MQWHDHQGTQTHISLADKKYDELLSSNTKIDALLNLVKKGLQSQIEIEQHSSLLSLSKKSQAPFAHARKHSEEFKTFENEEFDAILKYLGLAPQDKEGVITSAGEKAFGSGEQLFTKDDLYMYLHGKGEGAISNLRTKVRIASRNYFEDAKIKKEIVVQEELASASDLDSQIGSFKDGDLK